MKTGKSIALTTALIVLILAVVVLIVLFTMNPLVTEENALEDNVESFGKEGGDFPSQPSCFTITPEGDLFIGAGNTLYRFSAEQVLSSTLEMEAPVTALLASGDGVYVAAGSGLFWTGADSKAILLSDLGGNSIIKSIKELDDRLYLSDAGNKILYCFTDRNRLSRIYSFQNPPELQIVSPWFDFIVLSDAGFWITNPGDHQIDLYNADGEYQRSIPGSEETVLFEGCCNPKFMEITGDGRLLTWEKGVHRLRILDSEGLVLSTIPAESFSSEEVDVVDMTLWNDRLYLLDTRRIYIVDVP